MKLRNVGQGDEGFRSVGAGAEHDDAADQIDLADGSGKGQIAAAGLAAAAQSQPAQQTQQAAATTGSNVANTVAAISETTAGVSNTLSSLATIFSLFGGNQ